MAQLKVRYGSQLKALKDVFPDWTTEDLAYTLQEVDGDLDLATDRITGGMGPPEPRFWSLRGELICVL